MSLSLPEFEAMESTAKIETPKEVTDFYGTLLTTMNGHYNLNMTPYNIIIKANKPRSKLAHIKYAKKEIVIYYNMKYWKTSLIHETVHQLIHIKNNIEHKNEEVHSFDFWMKYSYYCYWFGEEPFYAEAYAPKWFIIYRNIYNNIPLNEAISEDELIFLLPQYDRDTIHRFIMHEAQARAYYFKVRFDGKMPYMTRT